MVYRDEMRVACHYRVDNDHRAWYEAEARTEGRVPFPCPAIDLSLAEIYRGLAPTG